MGTNKGDELSGQEELAATMRQILTDALYTEVDRMKEEGDADLAVNHVEFVIRADDGGVTGTILAEIDGELALMQAEICLECGRGCEHIEPHFQAVLFAREEALAVLRVVSKTWPDLLGEA